MFLRSSTPNLSLMLSTTSLLLAVVSIQLGRRLSYLDHLATFNVMAMTMLALVAAGFALAIVPLVRARGRSVPLWLATALSTVVLGMFLLDG